MSASTGGSPEIRASQSQPDMNNSPAPVDGVGETCPSRDAALALAEFVEARLREIDDRSGLLLLDACHDQIDTARFGGPPHFVRGEIRDVHTLLALARRFAAHPDCPAGMMER